MAASGVNPAAGLAVAAERPAADWRAASPVELVDFAVGQVLREETAADALPAILGGLAVLFGCRAAYAFAQDAGQEPVVLAAHPRRAAADQAMRAEICALSADYGDVPAQGGFFQAALTSGDRPGRQPMSVLLAYSAPAAGRCLCAVALVGDAARWNAESRATVRAIAAVVAAQIRHASDAAELASRRPRAPAVSGGSPQGIVVTSPVVTSPAVASPVGASTEVERAHAALQESEARLRLLSQLAPVGIIETGLDGKVTFANDRWCEMTGMTSQEVVGARWSAGFYPDDIKRLEREWQRAAATDGELRTDCRLRPAGGSLVWAHLAVVAFRAADGTPLGFLTAVTNVSDRKRAEAEKEELLNAEREARRSLADQTERLNGLVSAAIPGILLDDEHGRIMQVNQSFCDLFGIVALPSQLIGTPAARIAVRIRRVFTDPDEFVRRAAELVADRRPVALEEIACADGRTLEWDYAPVFVNGDYRGNLWGVADATERQVLAAQREQLLAAGLAAREAAERAQFKLAEQNVRLHELDEAKTQFLATMSHELRTPLTSIMSFTELILDDEQELTQETISSLSVIQRNAARLGRLVGDLLLLNRLEAGVIPLEFAAVSIPELVGEAIRSVSATAAERGITVQVAVSDGPPVQADWFRLQQVLDNLLSNAVKFSGQDGRIRVEASRDGQLWRIDVADNGIGIPADELGQLFGRFVRASNARTAGLPGTGLGLSVVKAITELHGGRVELRSTVRRGTIFSVFLPISRAYDRRS